MKHYLRLVAVVDDEVAELVLALPELVLHLRVLDLLPPEPLPLLRLPLGRRRDGGVSGRVSVPALGAALAAVEVVVKVGLLAEAAAAVGTHHLLAVVRHLGVRGQVPPRYY